MRDRQTGIVPLSPLYETQNAKYNDRVSGWFPDQEVLSLCWSSWRRGKVASLAWERLKTRVLGLLGLPLSELAAVPWVHAWVPHAQGKTGCEWAKAATVIAATNFPTSALHRCQLAPLVSNPLRVTLLVVMPEFRGTKFPPLSLFLSAFASSVHFAQMAPHRAPVELPQTNSLTCTHVMPHLSYSPPPSLGCALDAC